MQYNSLQLNFRMQCKTVHIEVWQECGWSVLYIFSQNTNYNNEFITLGVG